MPRGVVEAFGERAEALENVVLSYEAVRFAGAGNFRSEVGRKECQETNWNQSTGIWKV